MLRHIVENFDHLAKVTIFTTSDVKEGSAHWDALQQIIEEVGSPEKRAAFSGFKTRAYFPIFMTYDRPDDQCRPSIRPLGAWYARFINQSDTRLQHMSSCTASSVESIFAVSSDRVRRLSRSVYEGLLQEVGHCQSPSSAAGHFLERSWPAMFTEECHVNEAAKSLRRWTAEQQAVPEGFHDPSVDLVVAHYKADLDWIAPTLSRIPKAKLHLYCKGNVSQDPRCIRMENVGTEEYAYFKHILDHYDELADITIFTIDNMQNTAGYKPTTRECLDFSVSAVDTPAKRAHFRGFEAMHFMLVTGKFDIEFYHASATPGASLMQKRLCRASAQPFGEWYLRFINPNDSNFARLYCTAASMHGIFAVSAKQIRRVPKEQFRALVAEVERCRGSNHFVAGHYMERSWAPLFAERCHKDEAQYNYNTTREGNEKWKKMMASLRPRE